MVDLWALLAMAAAVLSLCPPIQSSLALRREHQQLLCVRECTSAVWLSACLCVHVSVCFQQQQGEA